MNGSMARPDRTGEARTAAFEAEPSGLRPLAAEALGSGFLAFFIVCAGILAERHAIHDVGLALLMTALAGAGAFGVLAAALGRRSPSFFNPALALALTLSGRLTPQTGLLIAAAHFAAAPLGVMIAHLVCNTGLVQVATKIHPGEAVWAGDMLAAGLFVFAMLAATARGGAFAALLGALCLLAASLATPSASFANPAITLARALTDSFTAIRLEDALLIGAAQMAGGAGGWLLARWLLPERLERGADF